MTNSMASARRPDLSPRHPARGAEQARALPRPNSYRNGVMGHIEDDGPGRRSRERSLPSIKNTARSFNGSLRLLLFMLPMFLREFLHNLRNLMLRRNRNRGLCSRLGKEAGRGEDHCNYEKTQGVFHGKGKRKYRIGKLRRISNAPTPCRKSKMDASSHRRLLPRSGGGAH